MPKILVVDDEVLVARDLKQRLEDLGYEVSQIASSGKEAVEIASDAAVDLLLMDINLGGGIDGIETAAQVRKHKDIPVVYLTAYSDQATLDRAKATDPFGYILKPLQNRELAIAVQMALHKHRMETEIKRLNKDLQESLAQVKKLSGLLPICANCKKIRDDQGYWKSVESYIQSHSDATFTHGCCPDCLEKYEQQMRSKKGQS